MGTIATARNVMHRISAAKDLMEIILFGKRKKTGQIENDREE
jgi:hypothetical protein